MIKGDISKNSPLILDRLLKIITKQTNNTTVSSVVYRHSATVGGKDSHAKKEDFWYTSMFSEQK